MSFDNWKTLKLEEIKAPKKYSFVGGPFGSNLVTRDYVEQGVPVIRGTNLSGDHRFSLEDLVYVSEEKANDLLPNNAHPGDVVFTQRGTLGQIGIIPKDSGYDRFVISQSQMKLSVDENQAEALYVYYFFKSTETIQKIHNLAFSSGVPHINLQILREFEIPLPPLPTQRHIAGILSAYDDLIENNTRRIRILEGMAQTIYQEWFGKVDKESLLKGWELKPFGELLSFDVNGGWGEEEQSEQFSVPAYVIRGTDIPSGRYGQFDKVPFRYHKQSNFQSRQLLLGDIVIEIAGGSKGQPVGRALLIGKGILHKFDGQVICASFCNLVRPNQDIISPEYLYMHLREIYQNGQIEKYQTQSTGIINFKSSFFLQDNIVIVPDKAKMDEFTEIIRPMFQMIETLGSKNANLRQTRDLLLPRLVSGEIAVHE